MGMMGSEAHMLIFSAHSGESRNLGSRYFTGSQIKFGMSGFKVTFRHYSSFGGNLFGFFMGAPQRRVWRKVTCHDQ